MKTTNNLGVTYYRLNRSTTIGGDDMRSLAYLSFSSEYYDATSRDPDTLERTPTKNLGWVNTYAVLHPMDGLEPTIYSAIPKDTEADRF